MKQLFVFIKKEFYHVLRDPKTLLILFGMPIIQVLIFGFALTNEVKNSKIVIVDHAHDDASRAILARIEASDYFDFEKASPSSAEIEADFKNGKIKMAVVIPSHFGYSLQHEGRSTIQLILDASDPNTATTLTNYISSIIQAYAYDQNMAKAMPFQIVPEIRMLYNPQLKGAPNFVPGVIALVLMLVSVMMTAIAIVKEKETGTMEVLLVSPFKPAFIIIAKAIPYLILSLINIVSILLLSVYVLDLPIQGSLWLLMAESTLFIISCLTLGILISIKTNSQQVAMLISLMGLLLPTLLFSGFMFPIENMPMPLQVISNIIPAKWFYIIVKSIMIKGLGWSFIWKETLVLLGMTLILFVVSLKSFNIRLS